MSESLEQEVRILRARFWSSRDPDGRAFAPLADAYRRKGELAEARTLVREGLERLPDFTTGHLVAARVARDQGDLLAAREHLDRVIDLDPRNAIALSERAAVLEGEGNREGVIADLRRVLELEPEHAGVRERLARMEEGGEGVGSAAEGAMADSETPEREAEPPDAGGAATADAVRARYTRTMGDLYVRQGFPERAVEVYEYLLDRDPDDTALAERLEEARRQVGGRGLDAPGDAAPEGEEDLDAVAPQWSGGRVDADASPTSPFTWAREEDPDLREAPPDGRTIGAYFEELLAWEPGGVPSESLAPEDGDPGEDDDPTPDPEGGEPPPGRDGEEDGPGGGPPTGGDRP